MFLHRSWRRVADLAIAVGIGAAVAAPQLLASIAAKRDSSLGFGRSLEELESPTLSAQPDRIVQILLGSFRHVDEAVFAGGFESIGHVGVAAAFARRVRHRDCAARSAPAAAGDRARRDRRHRRGVGTRAAHAGVHGRLRLAPRLRPRTGLGPMVGRDRLQRRVGCGVGCGRAHHDGAANRTTRWWVAVGRRRRRSPRASPSALGAAGASDLPDGWTVASWLAVAAIVIAALLLARRVDRSHLWSLCSSSCCSWSNCWRWPASR